MNVKKICMTKFIGLQQVAEFSETFYLQECSFLQPSRVGKCDTLKAKFSSVQCSNYADVAFNSPLWLCRKHRAGGCDAGGKDLEEMNFKSAILSKAPTQEQQPPC